MIIALLTILLYGVAAAIVLELIFWIISLFIAVPPRIRQLIYALVGVLLIIAIVQLLLGGGVSPMRLPLR